ncbi:MAG TPA: hypothetical protein VF406_20870 [Thermodesulfobacteriota bacterium]
MTARRWTPGREVAAWARAARGVAVTLALAAAALVVLRVAGLRGLLVAAAAGALVWWLSRLGRSGR